MGRERLVDEQVARSVVQVRDGLGDVLGEQAQPLLAARMSWMSVPTM